MPHSSSYPQVYFKVPLVNLWTAVAALDRSEDKVLALVDEGKLRWAWNTAAKSSGKRNIRILASSIAEFQSGERAPRLSDEEEFQRAINCIFPFHAVATGGIASISETNLARRFNLSHRMLPRFVEDGCLRLVKGSVRRRGAGGSAQIEFASVIEFLRKRRIA